MAKKILVIDDDADFKEAIETLLEAKGYEVMTASDGKEGFKKAKEASPQLILLDVMMTHKTEGFDIALNLKNEASTKAIPVIMVTGIRREMSLPFGFEPDENWLPVKQVLEKPVKPEVLLKAVQEHIGA
jgi:DNA-binding response OmpR family regulator